MSHTLLKKSTQRGSKILITPEYIIHNEENISKIHQDLYLKGFFNDMMPIAMARESNLNK